MSERMIQGESETRERTTTERTTTERPAAPAEPEQEGGADRESSEDQAEETEGR